MRTIVYRFFEANLDLDLDLDLDLSLHAFRSELALINPINIETI